jgi:hypothetical protein
MSWMGLYSYILQLQFPLLDSWHYLVDYHRHFNIGICNPSRGRNDSEEEVPMAFGNKYRTDCWPPFSHPFGFLIGAFTGAFIGAAIRF